MSAVVWSDDETQLVRKLWLLGRSAGDIAKAMPGRTRNSVLGAIHRMPDMPKRITTLLRSRPVAKTPSAPKPKPAPESLKPEIELLPADPPIYTIDLRDTHCHWPYDAPGGREFIYCGAAKKEGMPYCPGHARIAFQPKQVRTRNAG